MPTIEGGETLNQTTETVRNRSSFFRTLTLTLPLIGLTGCIPQHVRDLEWCRNLETAKPLIDERGQANLNIAMTKNKCADKILEPKKAAEEAAKKAEEIKAAKSKPSASKQTIKKPDKK